MQYTVLLFPMNKCLSNDGRRQLLVNNAGVIFLMKISCQITPSMNKDTIYRKQHVLIRQINGNELGLRRIYQKLGIKETMTP